MTPEGELARRLHKQARKAIAAVLDALAQRERVSGRAMFAELSDEQVTHALRVGVLRYVLAVLAYARGLSATPASFERARLFASTGALDIRPVFAGSGIGVELPSGLESASVGWLAALGPELTAGGFEPANAPLELLGNLYELLLGERVGRAEAGAPLALGFGRQRKQSGTFFTPRALTTPIVAQALDALDGTLPAGSGSPSVCDPAVGGGAFLLELARAWAARLGAPATAEQRLHILQGLFGVDVSALAIAVAEASLWLFVGDSELPFEQVARNLRVGDALVGTPCRARDRAELALGPGTRACDFLQEFPQVFARGGFDLVIGNPPWVAYAGRAAAPLSPTRRAYFSAEFRSLRGYPTLHGLFVERAARLAPRGVVALLVPSPIADLDGYRAVRRTLRESHQPLEPLLEFGQDAFESVTQPCFALVARPTASTLVAAAGDAPFRLAERQKAEGSAEEVRPPEVLARLARGPSLPAELFGEMGFQTAAQVSKTLLKRTQVADARHSYPLLEGRDVHEFRVGPARLYLEPDRAALAAARCRLRPADDYRRVRFVVRQTARFPIAALHDGTPFRNSLLAGFDSSELPGALLVGLLNSSLYRALHLGLRRDARQATFPQVKIAHLRALPRPPEHPERRAHLIELAERATESGLDEPLRRALNDAVFALFGLEPSEQAEIAGFLAARGGERIAAPPAVR